MGSTYFINPITASNFLSETWRILHLATCERQGKDSGARLIRTKVKLTSNKILYNHKNSSSMFSLTSKFRQFSSPASQLYRAQSTLVLAEHNNEKLNPVTLHAITAAKQLGGDINCIVVGSGNCTSVAKELAEVGGISKILVAENAAFKGFLPETLAPFILASQEQFKFTHILAGASAFSRSLLPRVAAKLDVSPISDIIGIKDADTFVRTIYAGNAIMTLKSLDPVKIVTVRSTAFEAAVPTAGNATPIEDQTVPG